MPKPNHVVLKDVQIMFRNFKGKKERFNNEGSRYIKIIISPEHLAQLYETGIPWNIKTLMPKEGFEEQGEKLLLEVAISYPRREGIRPPQLVMVTSRGKTNLTEETAELLDWPTIIVKADMEIRAWHWQNEEADGWKAQLVSLYATIEEDELELMYADVPDSAQDPSLDYHDDTEEF